MVRQDGAELRKQRISQIAQSVQKSLNKQNPLPLSQSLATIQYETGLTKEKVMEYLKLMESIGQFVLDIENDMILRVDVAERILGAVRQDFNPNLSHAKALKKETP